MRKLCLLIGKGIMFFCFIMVLLFVYDFFFWSKTAEGRNIAKAVIIFFSLAGFFTYSIHSMMRRVDRGDGQDPWERLELQNDNEKDYLALGYALPQDMTEHIPAHGPEIRTKYKLKVLGLAIAGYAYIFGMFCGLASLVYHLVGFALAPSRPYSILALSLPVLFVVTVFLGALLKSVRLRIEQPKGVEIDGEDAPELFETINHLGERLHGPKIHRVVLTGDFSIRIVRGPRLGILGWHKNCLVLGLPLLQGLSVTQTLALLAHEYSHLSGEQGWFDSWIYRLRQTWMEVMKRLESKKHWSRIIIAPFFRWYAPYFHSYTLPLAKAQEYAADRCSAAFAGESETAAALVRTRVLEIYLQESFWSLVTDMMDTQPEPVSSVYGLMQAKFQQGIDSGQAKEWLDRSLQKESGPADLHPDLRKRLSAIREAPVFQNSTAISAAQYYFSDLDSFRKVFDDEWRSFIRGHWHERYAYVQKMRTRIEELSSKARYKPLSVEEALDLAYMTEDLSGSEKALPLFHRILKFRPNCVPALCAAGRIALAKGDETGASYIERVIALDENYSVYGLEALYNFYLEKGDREKTGKYYQRLSDQKEMIEVAERARKLETERAASAEKIKKNARKKVRTERMQPGFIKVCPVENHPIFP